MAERIVAALGPDGRAVLEVGPGRGALTGLLGARAARLVAVELDRTCVDTLRIEPATASAEIVHGDILERPLADWMAPVGEDGFLLAGNLPYAITSPVLFACFDATPLLQRAVLMIQREVAERLCAPAGDRTYGVLSVFAAVHAEPELLFTVGRGAFKPPPRVESAVVSLVMRASPAFGLGSVEGPSLEWFRRVVKAAFGQRRKMLRNSLLSGLPGLDRERLEAAADSAGLTLTDRAERIGPEGFVRLARALAPAEAV